MIPFKCIWAADISPRQAYKVNKNLCITYVGADMKVEHTSAKQSVHILLIHMAIVSGSGLSNQRFTLRIVSILWARNALL
jgi:hypothetical protein